MSLLDETEFADATAMRKSNDVQHDAQGNAIEGDPGGRRNDASGARSDRADHGATSQRCETQRRGRSRRDMGVLRLRVHSTVVAVLAALVVSAFVTDAAHAGQAAALVGSFVAIVVTNLVARSMATSDPSGSDTTMSSDSTPSHPRSPRRSLIVLAVSVVAGAASALGAWLTSDLSAASTLTGQLVVVWAVASLVAHRSDPLGGESSPTHGTAASSTMRRDWITWTAAAVTASIALALAVPTVAASATTLALAAPVALVGYWVLADRPRVSRTVEGARTPVRAKLGEQIAAPLGALGAGAVAAALASVAVPSDVSRASLVVALAISVVVACLSATNRLEFPSGQRHSTRQRVATVVAMVVVAVACGAGGVVPIVAVALGGYSTLLAAPARRRDSLNDHSARTTRFAVSGLTLVAFALRLYTGRGLWLDETTSVHQARLGFTEMIRFIGETDNHPPLHYIVLWLDIRLVGNSELALRLPMIVMGVALVPVLFLIGREFFSRRVGVYSAAIGTVAPVAVWYGQEARMYSQFMLLAALSVYATARIIRTGELRYWTLFTVASVALVYTQYFAVLHVAATIVVLAIEILRRRNDTKLTPASPSAKRLVKGLVGSIVAQTVLIAPLVPYALAQATRNQDEGFGFSASSITSGTDVVPPPGIYGFLTNLQWAFLGYLPDDVSIRLIALWPIGLLIGLLVLGTQRQVSNRILLTIAGIPMLILFATSFVAADSRSLAEVRYFSGAVPVLFVLLAAGIVSIVRTVRLQRIVVATVMGTMLVALVVQQVDGENPRLYEYREAIEQIRDDARPGDQIVYAPEYLNYTLEYYDPDIDSAPLEDGLPVVADGNSLYVIEAASFADSAAADRLAGQQINDLVDDGATIVETFEYAQITVTKIEMPS